jgi:hypothetical protein
LEVSEKEVVYLAPAYKGRKSTSVQRYSAGGAYVNFMMDEGADRLKATYRGNYERLVRLKNLYDPTNLFRVNQNIKPTV